MKNKRKLKKLSKRICCKIQNIKEILEDTVFNQDKVLRIKLIQLKYNQNKTLIKLILKYKNYPLRKLNNPRAKARENNKSKIKKLK